MKSKFADMKIGTRIITGFLMVAVIAMIIGAVGTVGLYNTNKRYSTAFTETVSALDTLDTISSDFQRVRMNLYAVVLAASSDDKAFYAERISNYSSVVAESMDSFKKTVDSGAGREGYEERVALYNAMKTNMDAYKEARTKFLQTVAMDASRQQEGFEAMKDGGDLRNLAVKADDSIQALIDYAQKDAANTKAENAASAQFAIIFMLLWACAGVAAAILTGVTISRQISRPIKNLVAAADRLSQGDVKVHVESAGRNEIGVLAEAFDRMVENIRGQVRIVERIAAGDYTMDVQPRSADDLLGTALRDMVNKNNQFFSHINNAAEQVAVGSEQVSAGAQALAQGATEQASSVEELSASITEISGEIERNAHNSADASRAATEATNEVETGSRHMQELTAAITEISESSNQISRIIKTIEDIAFQTNILALNAAVEAARAGSAGKGFAVVADEVRNLASKSAEAAKDTTALIQNSIAAVEKGTRIAGNTGEALQNIIASVKASNDRINEISKSTNEAAASIAQVTQGVDQISAVVQTNSATAEESAATSEELSGQAQMLKSLIASLKLREQRADSAADGSSSGGEESVPLSAQASRQQAPSPAAPAHSKEHTPAFAGKY